MSLDRCIKDTAGELGLKESDVRQISERLRDYKKRRVAEGRLDRMGEDVRKFAADEAEKVKIAAALKRKQAALNVVLRDEWDADLSEMIAGGMTRREAILAKLVGSYEGVTKARKSAGNRRGGLESDWLGGMVREIHEQLPHVLPLLRKPDAVKSLLDDTVRAWRSLAQGPLPAGKATDAHKLASILAKYAEASRIDANKAGAAIGQLRDWGGPQAHDAAKLLRAGKDAWVAGIINRLDHERSFGKGTTYAKAHEILEKTFDTIVTGRNLRLTAKRKGERVSPANLARSLEAERVLHFKTADDWLAYAEQFSRGNVFTGMIDHLRQMARTVANMQVMGPNPQVFLDAILETQRDQARRAAPADVKKAQKEIDRLNADLDNPQTPIAKAFAEIMGHTFQPASLHWAKFWAGVRSVQSMAKLGGALIASFNDVVTFAHGMRFQGKGLFQAYGDSVNALLGNYGGRDRQHVARLLGVGYDAILGDIHSRFAADDNLPGRMSQAQQAFFRLTGLTWWTERLENAFVHMASVHMASHSDRAWDDLPPAYQHVLGLHGIDGERWEVVRQLVEKEGDYRFVFPELARGLDAGAFDRLIGDEMEEAEDAIRERIGAQSRSRAESAVKRAETTAEKVRAAVKEATDKLQARQQAGKSTFHQERSVNARRRKLAQAEDAVRLRQEAVQKASTAPVRDLTDAERADLGRRRERLIERARRELELDLRSYFADEASFAVLKGDDRTRMYTTQGTQPGSLLGEAIRFMLQFKSFPIAYITKVLNPALRGRGPGGSRDYGAIATLIAATWVVGYLSMTVKDAIKNRTPKDPTRWETILAALIQGGGAGLYGDFLFARRDRFGSGPAGAALGPAAGTAISALEIWQDIVHGEARAGDAFYLALGNTPGLNIWWLRTGLDFLILNALQDMISPGTLQRRERRLKKDFGQEYLLEPTPLAG
jgi:hypothetical protein